MAQAGLKGSSSKFFVIYAHDNNDLRDYPANAAIVQRFINWFKKLFLDVDSDRSPHGWAPGRGAEIAGASNDILKNQMCLLPPQWGIQHADWVLVFGSELLGKYIQDEQDCRSGAAGGGTYSQAIVSKCCELDESFREGAGLQEMREDFQTAAYNAIAKIRKEFSAKMGSKFHHVLTELALLEFRRKQQASQHIVPILLGGDHTKSFPSFVALNETLLRIKVDHQDPYSSLFKILLRFEAIEGDRHLIGTFERCFLDCKKRLLGSKDKPGQAQANCGSIILRTLRELHSSPKYHKLERQVTVPEIQRILNLHILLDSSSIQRVSGDSLPKGSKDVDLVPQGTKGKGVVAIHQLFDPVVYKTAGGGGERKVIPKRILIRGLPGIGKSTLSRRIAFEYSWRKELVGKHDLVVRLPIRKLEYGGDLEQVLFDEFFKLQHKGHQFAEKLKELILTPTPHNKILFILDGLDEIQTRKDEKNDLLSKLVNQEIVVITSRLSGIDTVKLQNIDLQLDATGLSMENVWAYLNNREVVRTEAAAMAIRHAIKTSQVPEGMIRVPIHLDMLCYSWDELERQRDTASSADIEGNIWATPPMVTEIYQAITQKLWRRDIPDLGKWDGGRQLTKNVIEAIRIPRRLERIVQPEIRLLGKLAITLSAEGRVQFTDADIDTAIEELELESAPLPLDLESNLPRLSFLHQEPHGAYQKTYRFVHLTFQEFFAASYLVRDRTLLEKHGRMHKSSGHYEGIWQHVAGLLPSEHVDVDFFCNLLELEPQDLVTIRSWGSTCGYSWWHHHYRRQFRHGCTHHDLWHQKHATNQEGPVRNKEVILEAVTTPPGMTKWAERPVQSLGPGRDDPRIFVSTKHMGHREFGTRGRVCEGTCQKERGSGAPAI
jgi:hypothetical protein